MSNEQPTFNTGSVEGLQEQLNWYEKEMVPVNNMGKWARQVAIDSIKRKIKQKQRKK